MNKLILFIVAPLLFCVHIYAKTVSQIDKEISSVQNRLAKQQTDAGSLQSKVDTLSKDISIATKQFNEIEKMLAINEEEITQLAAIVNAEKNEKESLTKQRDKLIVEKDMLEKRLVDILANHTAQSLVLDKNEPISSDDIIKETLFFALRDQVKNESGRLNNAYLEKLRQVKEAQTRVTQMQHKLDRLRSTQKQQSELRSKQAQLLELLNKRKRSYLADLNKLLDQKNRERQLLADLSVMRQKTADQMKNQQSTQEPSTYNVKLYGTSYQQASKSDYKGKKVRAPLDDKPISVTKEFGPYTDPIYNIKIHNDSVTLKPTGNDALVRSVLPGKVIYADSLKLLGKVVIVEHKNNMHTIYRNLESIAPNIRVDHSLKERESIGRINKELVFEVTKDGLPINPLQLISI